MLFTLELVAYPSSSKGTFTTGKDIHVLWVEGLFLKAERCI